MKKTVLALTLVLCLLCGAALADSISFSGTVEARETQPVYIPTGVTVEDVPVKAGQTVSADTVIARLKTTKVYAEEDGTIAAVFGTEGDDAETVTGRYGAVMYLEGPYTLTISTTISKAYDLPENDIVHPGEKVYLISRAHTNMKGEGFITLVDGSNYTLLVSEGEFLVGDSVAVYRESSFSLPSCLGRGNIARVSPTALTASGSIVSIAVKAGDQVKKGQLLFETVSGTFDGPDAVTSEVTAGVDGVVASLSVDKGASLSQSTVAATIYPKDALWVAAQVPEMDLKELTVGEKVKVELDWNQEMGVTYDGTVELISSLGTVGEESTTYPVYVSFTPDDQTRIGMTALVTTLEDGEEAGADAADAEEQETEEQSTEEAEAADAENRGAPDRGEGRNRDQEGGGH